MAALASLKPIFFVSQMCGIFPFVLVKSRGSFTLRESRKRLIHTKVIFIIFLSLQIYIIWVFYYQALNIEHVQMFLNKIVIFLSTGSVFASVSSVFTFLLKDRNKLCAWLNRIADMFSNLGETPWKRMALFFNIMLSLLLVVNVTAYTSDVYFQHVAVEEKKMLKEFLFALFCYYVMTFVVKVFVQLFLMFVNLLRCYYVETHKKLRMGIARRGEKAGMNFLRDLRLKDVEIHDLLEFLQQFFIPVVSLQLFWGFATFLFGVGIAKKVGVSLITQCLWTIFVFWDFFIVATICDHAEKESEKTSHYLHEMFIYSDSREIKKEIELFSLQLLHQKVEFIAMGCHRINLTLVYTIIGSLTSYAVIMLQFQDDHQNSVTGTTANISFFQKSCEF